MNVSVCSKMAAYALMKKGFPENVSVISFYSSAGKSDTGRNRVDYSNACDSVFYVCAPDIDESGYDEYGYTDETFLAEANELADFVFSAVVDGRDIICQCDFGTCRSAACAAAILEHFEGRGDEIFSNKAYTPNMLVYRKVLEALLRKENMTPVDHIRDLIESIKDGKLRIARHYPFEISCTKAYDVSCAPTDADEFVSRYETLTNALEAIGKAHDKLSAGVAVEDVLTPEEIEIFNIYIRGFNDFDAGEYNLNELYMRLECGVKLSDAEHETIDRHYQWFGEQCLERLPKRAYPSKFLVNRAQRYKYFISKGAPKSVIDEEGRALAEEMILYYTVISD